MSAAQVKLGFAQKIGYSFVGLMAGNVVSLLVLVLISALPLLHMFPEAKKVWNLDIAQAMGLSLAIWIVSMLGWVVVGLPVVLLLRTEIVAEFYWITAALLGAVMGLLTMLLFYLAMNQGRLDASAFRNPEGIRTMAILFSAAGLIAGVAFAVYCALVQAALRRQAKENGAPKGTPRSLAWFDF